MKDCIHTPREPIAAFCHSCAHCHQEIEAADCPACGGIGGEWVGRGKHSKLKPCKACGGTGVEKWVAVGEITP